MPICVSQFVLEIFSTDFDCLSFPLWNWQCTVICFIFRYHFIGWHEMGMIHLAKFQLTINNSWNIRDSHALNNECVTFSCHKFHKYLKKYFTPIRWFFFSRFYFHSHSDIYFFHLLFFLWFFCRATIFVCVNFPLILLK